MTRDELVGYLQSRYEPDEEVLAWTIGANDFGTDSETLRAVASDVAEEFEITRHHEIQSIDSYILAVQEEIQRRKDI